jgi:error-prone DNA polymerase
VAWSLLERPRTRDDRIAPGTLPHFDVPAGHDDDSWLHHLAFEGARERWGEVDERQRGQLEHELGVIRRLGCARRAEATP